MDPATVSGTGKGGRVTKGDLLAADHGDSRARRAVARQPAAARRLAAPKAAAARWRRERATRSKLSPLRKRIAERLVSAQHNAAILTTFNEVDMSAVMALRKKYQEDFTARHGVKLGFMSFFVKAVVQALQSVPARQRANRGRRACAKPLTTTSAWPSAPNAA